MSRNWWYVALIAASISATVVAGDRDDYNQRSAERFLAIFRSADVNLDTVVSREEATGTVDLVAHFEDIDINRDGYISWDELSRFIDATFRRSSSGSNSPPARPSR